MSNTKSNQYRNFDKHIRKFYWWLFIAITLSVINFVVLMYNVSSWVVAMDDTTTILLTVLGFLFAFAGINIYSIFNTNIDSEKKALHDLSDEYEKKLNMNMEEMNFLKLLSSLQTYSLLIGTTETNNSQFLNWVTYMRQCVKDISLNLKNFEANLTHKEYGMYRKEYETQLRGCVYLLKKTKRTMENHETTFFSQSLSHEDITVMKEKLSSLVKDIEDEIGADDNFEIGQKHTWLTKYLNKINGVIKRFLSKDNK